MCDSDMIASDCVLLNNVYTFVSAAWGSTSWLDHCVSSEDAHSKITSISVLNEYVSSDHLPLCVSINIDFIKTLLKHEVDTCDAYNTKIDWSKATQEKLNLYSIRCNEFFNNINVTFINTLSCKDYNCKCDSHIECIDQLYCCIKDNLLSVANEVFNQDKLKCKKQRIVLGWSDYVSDTHYAARDAFLIWQGAGKPRQGPIFEIMKRSRAIFKCSLRYCRRNQAQIRAESLARKMASNNYLSFWKVVKLQQQTKTSIVNSIDKVEGTEQILHMWKDNYKTVFQKCNYATEEIRYIDNCVTEASYDPQMLVSADEISTAVFDLSNGKSVGFDGLSAEHLKYAGDELPHLLAILFTAMFIHGIVPKDMVKSVLVPIVKSKTKSLSDKSNYRPVTLATVISKVLEKIILTRIEKYLFTCHNQFGFKRCHGTDLCIVALKEVVNYYIHHSSNVFVAFLDASMAFDNLHHCKLFYKLIKRRIPVYIIRILWYWYRHQLVAVRWNNKMSEYFKVTNGVKQGGLLSPMLYNVYVDDLSCKLNNSNAGCYINNILVNHFMYADDIALLAPSVKGLQKLVNVCPVS